ncbi:MAG TPA: DNA-directed RNA polymerase subunit omega [Firmicutes bacterium]|nr:DNA-directed RNA polymerase subunit omega [Bacillota bacterium]
MIYPSIDSLIEKVDSKYTLVILAAKRARQIKNELMEKEKKEQKSFKEVTLALEDIEKGNVSYERKKTSSLK